METEKNRNFRRESDLMVYEKTKRKQVSKGNIITDKLVILLVFAILLSPFVVAFWIMGWLTPKSAYDWFVFIFYVILLVATICLLSLYAYARLKRKRHSQTSS